MKMPAWGKVTSPLLLTAALVAWSLPGSAAVTAPRAQHLAGLAARATTAVTATCHPYASSLRPPSGPPQWRTAGSYVAKIRARGYLIAGIDRNAYPFGFVSTVNGQNEGFDIDMVNAVATAIFGSPKVRYVAISDSDEQRIHYVQAGRVDIVAHTDTINCSRLKQVDFSTVYFDTHQQVLVLANSRARSLADLRGQKVCATAGSDSPTAIAKAGAIPVLVTYWTDCLVLLQQGEVAAISTDAGILAGLKAQDRYTKLVGPPLNDQPYGLAISRQNPDFVRFVNAVLEQMRTDGQWGKSYAHWIGTPVPPWPTVEYED